MYSANRPIFPDLRLPGLPTVCFRAGRGQRVPSVWLNESESMRIVVDEPNTVSSSTQSGRSLSVPVLDAGHTDKLRDVVLAVLGHDLRTPLAAIGSGTKLLSQAPELAHRAAIVLMRELTTEAVVTLEQDKEGFRISRSALTLRASVPNLDQHTFARLAGDAEQNCAVSRVLTAEITLEARLVCT